MQPSLPGVRAVWHATTGAAPAPALVAASKPLHAELFCNPEWQTPRYPTFWVARGNGGEWDATRIQTAQIAIDLAADWIESVVQLVDILENTPHEGIRRAWWEQYPFATTSLWAFFGAYSESMLLAVREFLHRMFEVLTTEDAPLQVYIGTPGDFFPNAPGGPGADDYCIESTEDGGAAGWAWSGSIGFCPAVLDNPEFTDSYRARIIVHEVAHRAGAGHAIQPYCTSNLDAPNECRKEEECMFLAVLNQAATLQNADSFKYAIYRHNQDADGCHPWWWKAEQGGSGMHSNDDPTVYHSSWRLCTPPNPGDPTTPEAEWVCRTKLQCPFETQSPSPGGHTFKVCR